MGLPQANYFAGLLGSPFGARGDSRIARTRKRTGFARIRHPLAHPHLRVHQHSSLLPSFVYGFLSTKSLHHPDSNKPFPSWLGTRCEETTKRNISVLGESVLRNLSKRCGSKWHFCLGEAIDRMGTRDWKVLNVSP